MLYEPGGCIEISDLASFHEIGYRRMGFTDGWLGTPLASAVPRDRATTHPLPNVGALRSGEAPAMAGH
jgi:hypothetical protein